MAVKVVAKTKSPLWMQQTRFLLKLQLLSSHGTCMNVVCGGLIWDLPKTTFSGFLSKEPGIRTGGETLFRSTSCWEFRLFQRQEVEKYHTYKAGALMDRVIIIHGFAPPFSTFENGSKTQPKRHWAWEDSNKVKLKGWKSLGNNDKSSKTPQAHDVQ